MILVWSRSREELLSVPPTLSGKLEAEAGAECVEDGSTNENMKGMDGLYLNVDEYLADVREKRMAAYPPIGYVKLLVQNCNRKQNSFDFIYLCFQVLS